MLTLYSFGKKENGTWGKDALFDIMDDPTDVVATNKEFTNINKDDSVSDLDGIISFLCDISWTISLEWGWRRNVCPTLGCTIAFLYPACYRLVMWSINTNDMGFHG